MTRPHQFDLDTMLQAISVPEVRAEDRLRLWRLASPKVCVPGHDGEVVEHPFEVRPDGDGIDGAPGRVGNRTFDGVAEPGHGLARRDVGEEGEVAGRDQGQRGEGVFQGGQSRQVVSVPIGAHPLLLLARVAAGRGSLDRVRGGDQ